MVVTAESTMGITVFFDESLPEDEIHAIGEEIRKAQGPIIKDMKFTSAEEAVSKGNDIVSSQMAVHYSSKRRLVGDTDNGKALRERIQELTRLLEAYRKGIIKETK